MFDDQYPRCTGCGARIFSPPLGTSAQRRGDFAYVSEWRFCTCGAALCSQRIDRVESKEAATASV